MIKTIIISITVLVSVFYIFLIWVLCRVSSLREHEDEIFYSLDISNQNGDHDE